MLSVNLSSQLEHSALSLRPKPPSVSLHREHFQSTGILTLALSREESALPHGPELINCTAFRGLKWQRGKGREWNQEIIQKWGSSCEAVPGPLLSQLGFWLPVPGLFCMVTLAACDLLTVLQTFPHSGRFDILFTLLSSPESEHLSQTWLCLQLFRKFSQRGKIPPSSSGVIFLSQHFPQVYLC